MKREPIKWVVEDPEKKNVFWPSKEMKKRAWVSDGKIYEEAAKDPVSWWAKLAKKV